MKVHKIVQKIHESPFHFSLAITGGGSEIIPNLLKVGGGSASVLSVYIPYHEKALCEFLRDVPEKFCSVETARKLAVKAFFETQKIQQDRQFFGLGCSASLKKNSSERENREHWVHIAIQTQQDTFSFSIQLKKQRTREEEEGVCADLILNILAESCGLEDRLPIHFEGSEVLLRHHARAHDSIQKVYCGYTDKTTYDPKDERERPHVLFSSAFNPFHDGHKEIIHLAEKILKKPVHLELPLFNADKPPINYIEFEERVRTVKTGLGKDMKPLWLTRAGTFIDKAKLFKGNITFIIGMDTAARICMPKFYGSEEKMLSSLRELKDLDCHFLCFARRNAPKVSFPEAFSELTQVISPDIFLNDISSTEIRKRRQ